MTDTKRTVLFAAGGTAGHVFPAVAVARAVQRVDPGIEPVFVGTSDRLEGRLVPASGFDLYHIDAVPVPRRVTLGLFKVPMAIRSAVRRCEAIIAETAAVGAVTFGGYVSFPLARAAHREHLPLVIHEQNSVPGLANRVAARWADRVAVTFPGSADRFPRPEKVAVTGNPVREEILDLDPATARPAALEHFRLKEDRRTLLVFGGSQGARALNQAIVGTYGRWSAPDRLQVLHAAGRSLHGEAAAGWENARAAGDGPLVRCVDFIDDMSLAYAAADVVMCRAGATSFAELTAIGRASVLVPLPHATADHQLHNARALERAGGARVITHDDLSPRELVRTIEPLLEDDDVRSTVAAAARAFGRRDAADNVARIVLGEIGTITRSAT
ncbi:MAG: undecaprenyldiphospho-muramoylpentapeptide beta-N-acetylglucosaminyltransferase [Actinobacteria bacterium]|nr:undecaprenyldiphospho-muramoylpentapeptide beta-N-acetylglucosaminyltransferase [Actinomycetota bacterium]